MYMDVHVYVCVCMQMGVHVYVCVCVHVCASICVYVHVRGACVHVCMNVCMVGMCFSVLLGAITHLKFQFLIKLVPYQCLCD